MNSEKNAFPWEVDSRPRDPDMPRPLQTQADKEAPLSREEADVAGIGPTPEVVYGEDSAEPNEADHRDVHGG